MSNWGQKTHKIHGIGIFAYMSANLRWLWKPLTNLDDPPSTNLLELRLK